jgi:hypothetical protein
MSQDYFLAHYYFYKNTESLTDKEFGELMRAVFKYIYTDEEPELYGNNRFLFKIIKRQIDIDKKTDGKELCLSELNVAEWLI